MFTIKSISDEGVYYLINGWEKSRAFWKHGSEIKKAEMFKRAQDAKASLTKLLKVMDDYATDTFYLIETNDNDEIVSEVLYETINKRN